MIFSMIALYRQVKHGTQDPTGFAVEEIDGMFLDTILLPGIIAIAVTILLGILSFTQWIVHPTLVAKIFFWITLFGTILYFSITLSLRYFLMKLLRRGKSYIDVKL